MKKIIQYMSAFLMFVFMGTSCQDNENWVILTDVQPGYYVAGEATVYSSVAPAASFVAAPLSPRDGESADQFPGMYSKFTYLKAGSEFSIIKATADGTVTTYGKGNVVSGETTALVADAPAYTVPADGLYFLVLNTVDNQLTILTTPWEAIGAATPGGWSTGTPLTPSLDEAALKVNFTADLAMSVDNMKFRFFDWEILVPYGSADVRLFSNVGSVAENGGDAKLSGSPIELKDGGSDIGVSALANYKLTLSFDLKTSKFTASVVQGEVIEPTYPATMYVVGDGCSAGWDTANGLEMHPTPVEGQFWTIAYLNATGGFKFFPQKDSWDNGKGAPAGAAAGINDYAIGSENIPVPGVEGYYMLVLDMAREEISVSEVAVYGMGDAFGGWDAGTAAFTVDNATKEIIGTAAADGNLRSYASHKWFAEWWHAEINIVGTDVVYRGKGGDPAEFPLSAGQTVKYNLDSGTATIQ